MKLSRNTELIKSKYAQFFASAMLIGISANLAAMIDGFIVGNLIGSEALAAVNVCRPAMQVYGFCSEVLSAGFTGCISMLLGKRLKEEADRMFTSGMIGAVATAVILTIVQFLFADKICAVFANNETLIPIAGDYFNTMLFSVLFMLISEPLASAMRIEGRTVLAGAVLFAPHVCNAILDLLFVGVLKWGIRGAATATLIGYAIGFLIALSYVFSNKRTCRFAKGGRVDDFGQIVSTGISSAINMGLIAIKLLIVNRMVGEDGGKSGMAAMSILMIAWALQSLFIGGVSQTMMPMVSVYYGEGDAHGVRALFKHSLKILLGSVCMLVIFLLIFPQVLPYLMGIREGAEMSICITAVRIFALALPMEAFVMLMVRYYIATQNKRLSVIIATMQGIVAMVPVIYITERLFGLVGVWMAFPISGIIPVLLIFGMAGFNTERLLGVKGHEFLVEMSVKKEDISRTVEAVVQLLKSELSDGSTANKVGVVIEEMTVDAFARNTGKKLHVDIVVRKIDDEILISFSDDGMEYNLLEHMDESPQSIDSIYMLTKIAHKVDYSRVIGLNKTNIVLSL